MPFRGVVSGAGTLTCFFLYYLGSFVLANLERDIYAMVSWDMSILSIHIYYVRAVQDGREYDARQYAFHLTPSHLDPTHLV